MPDRLTFLENISLDKYCTFKTGGPTRFFVIVKSVDDLRSAVAFAKERSVPLFILGGGSNILISDAGFDGLVIKIEIGGVNFSEEDSSGNVKVTVGAGENWDDFVGLCVERGLCGVENLSYIPGTVGAAPVQNIGAYGVEVKDVIEGVDVLDTFDLSNDASEPKLIVFSNKDCQFGYRDSFFKRNENAGRYIITRVTFLLTKNGKVNTEYKDIKEYFASMMPANKSEPTLVEVREAIIEIRKKKLPDWHKVGTAGSFFKNPIISLEHYDELKKKYPDMPSYPVSTFAINAEKNEKEKNVKIPLAWILDRVCGFKGITRGNVGVYGNQALVIVNNGGGTTDEIKTLASEMISSVKEKTGMDIEAEVQYLP